jgi:hypothetical protein
MVNTCFNTLPYRMVCQYLLYAIQTLVEDKLLTDPPSASDTLHQHASAVLASHSPAKETNLETGGGFTMSSSTIAASNTALSAPAAVSNPVDTSTTDPAIQPGVGSLDQALQHLDSLEAVKAQIWYETHELSQRPPAEQFEAVSRVCLAVVNDAHTICPAMVTALDATSLACVCLQTGLGILNRKIVPFHSDGWGVWQQLLPSQVEPEQLFRTWSVRLQTALQEE